MSETSDIGSFTNTTIKVAVDGDGDPEVPAATHSHCPGLAVTMHGFGNFTVTHIGSGMRLVRGDYEKAASAIATMAKFALIAKEHGFSWADLGQWELVDKFKEIDKSPVPFEGATTTYGGETAPMSIGSWRELINISFPGTFLDTPPWDDGSADDDLDELLETLVAA